MTGVEGAWCLLVAAGAGTRLGLEQPKAFAPLAGRPLLAHSLERLEASDWIDAIVVVAPPGWEEPAILLTEELVASKVAAVVTGGETRSDSVRLGLAEIPPEALVIVVHDAARPLVTETIIGRVIAGLGSGADGSIPALPLADTIKRVEGNRVVETLDRSALVAAQTPQAFLPDIFRRAYAADDGAATDCAALVERAGGTVITVEGDPLLIKVTTPDDLDHVAALL